MCLFSPIRSAFIFSANLCLISCAQAEFGCLVEKHYYNVDTGAGLVFRVKRDNGSITSLKWKGVELNDATRPSGINSGLGGEETTCQTRTMGDVIVVEVNTTPQNEVAADMNHYYIVRKNEPTIYMATYAGKQPSVGELRWITRLRGELFDHVPEASSLRGCTGYVESRDVRNKPDGETRSKFYGNSRAMDLTISGVSGSVGHVFMDYGNRESSSGGPFFRDIQHQSSSNVEVYNYMNSGHAQTESYRTGVLHGPYALLFDQGAKPQKVNMDFMKDLGLRGWVNHSERGKVTIPSIQGMLPSMPYVVGFSQKNAQYWMLVKAGEKKIVSPLMKPGIYEMIVYQGELEVAHRKIEVTAGKTTEMADWVIENNPEAQEFLWRIGQWDGTPVEFRNGQKLPYAHPSDVRMNSWKKQVFEVSKMKNQEFPACLWMKVNNGQVIEFTLNKEQVKGRKLRVGITSSQSAARPMVHMNEWESRMQSAPKRMKSRALTIGTYRGENRTFTFEIPVSAFREGKNQLKIDAVSGSDGEGFLSPGFSVDCIDLQ